MKLTCSQMDVLISFYIEEELSASLKEQVESHLKECSTCRAKFEIIKSMLSELHKKFELEENLTCKESKKVSKDNSDVNTYQYRIFKTNLSAYIDNELSNEENIKIKKYTINNKKARRDLEDSYNIRRLMNDSFRKSKNEAKHDYSRKIIKALELEDEAVLGIHPAVKLIISFMAIVFILTTGVLIFLNI